MKKKVLFICVHNSARSQMAAALLNKKCGELFEAQSAGLEAGTLNPLAVEALHEIGVDNVTVGFDLRYIRNFSLRDLPIGGVRTWIEFRIEDAPQYPGWLEVRIV